MGWLGKISWSLAALCGLSLCWDTLRSRSDEPLEQWKPSSDELSSVVANDSVAKKREPQLKRSQPQSPAPAPALAPREKPRPATHRETPAIILEERFEMAGEPTRESLTHETTLQAIFDGTGLGDDVHLHEVNCRGEMCRGVLEIASEELDSAVFSRTFLHPEFVGEFSHAVSVTERTRNDDGSISATFYLHPGSYFAEMPLGAAEEEEW